jgi:multicomponent K+:H+ antiporter subunit C
MELLLAIVVGALTAAGIYLALRPRSFDLLLGLTLLTYAINLFVFGMGRLKVDQAPIVPADGLATLANHADPLPQALVLTAIVISFGMTAVLAAIAIRDRQVSGDDRTDAGEGP